jgi:hypothetical protein
MMAKNTNSHVSRFDRAVDVFKNHDRIMEKSIKNIAASVHHRLLSKARDLLVLSMKSCNTS